MSDSNRSRPQHPIVTAYKAFAENNTALLDGSAEGVYLANRISQAYSAGWQACEQRIQEALKGER